MQTIDVELLVLGAGLTGLSAGAVLGERATVVEADSRVGGLVRTECFEGYWFDRVEHILHFQDPDVRERILGSVSLDLTHVRIEAWVETSAGTARFPLQVNLRDLNRQTRVRCLDGLAKAAYSPTNLDELMPYDAFLLASLGEPLCELFFLPYNRKFWKRPLNTLVASGQTWNLLRPSLAAALEGAFDDAPPAAGYNADAFYPRPPADAAVRGMEVLSRALAARIPHMQLATRVESIDAPRRTVIAIRDGESVAYRYESCLSTIPLPTAIAMCDAAPAALREAAQRLRYNSVLSAMFSIRGPRPKNTGLWRYYPDESLRFTRLVFLHEYDPLLAPTDGWGLLAEVPVPAEAPRERTRDFLAAVRRDVIRAGALPADCEIIAENLVVAETAYVIFDRSAAETAKACRAWLAGHGIASLGRYGRWEYSSMAHALEQGNRWAEVVSSGMLWRDELYA